MELLAAAFPEDQAEELYAIVVKLQDRLGDINDHAVTCLRFERWLARSLKKKYKRRLRRRLADERARIESSIRKFDRPQLWSA